MSPEQQGLLKKIIAMQRHYPCRCCDWVWRRDHWERVRRPVA